GTWPNGVAFDGENIWVTNNFDDTVTKLRASDGDLQGTFNVGDGPYGVAFVVLGQSALTGDIGQALIAAGLLALIVTAVNIGLGRRARRQSRREPSLEAGFE
ncbi:YncE family protein, partial [Salinicola salarius]|uniref:YncE family protein n=1 Tax=Salinicola salarius TaxID=430457 RepID=UPI0026EF9C71